MSEIDQPMPTRNPAAVSTGGFYAALPSFSNFHDIVEPRFFAALPDDWSIGVADIVSSTQAIAAGRYKSVNTAGASVISAVSNALGSLDFPFIFAGDGASFAVGPDAVAAASEALAATVGWVGRELDLVLRGAMTPVSEIRAAGLDVRVARFAVSPNVTYAMFAGGGLAWVEERLKRGEIGIDPAPANARPDLTGLTCRFQDIEAKHGVILSLLARPMGATDDPRFAMLITDLLALIHDGPDAGHPIPGFRLRAGVRWSAIDMDARLHRLPGRSRLRATFGQAIFSLLATGMLAAKVSYGGFSARRYLSDVVANSDFRKYDDGLMMTLDCDSSRADALERRLSAARLAGIARYGLHRQRTATVTCVVPSVEQSNHVHFIDGGAGGYAMAAADLKSRAGGNA